MGTALTEQQIDALAKLAPTVLFCQDPDAAGQEAIRRGTSVVRSATAARRCAARLPVVRLPAGKDPADVVQSDGAEAMRSLLETSVPLARFEVELALERGDTRTPTVRTGSSRPSDPSSPHWRPASCATTSSGSCRNASTCHPDLVTPRSRTAPARLGTARRGRPPVNGARAALDRREQTERAFLAYCLALPDEGESRLAAATSTSCSPRPTPPRRRVPARPPPLTRGRAPGR
jgi:DNA primase